MNIRTASVAAIVLIALGAAACNQTRKATESTGTATATVKTSAPANVVSDSQLQSQAEHAADAASMPVNGQPANTNNTAPASGAGNASQ